MLLRATNLLSSAALVGRSLLQAANTLRAHNRTTEETQHRVADVFAGGRTASLHRLFHQGVVVLRQTYELEDCRVAETNLGRWIMRWGVGMHDPALDQGFNC